MSDDTKRLKSGMLDVPEAGAIFGLSRSSAYQAAANGYLPTIRIGRRIKVPIAALDRMIEEASANRKVAAG